MKISGFMIIKNGVVQGYPFIEAILSALPVCDEFLISEGYSSDETWKLLCELQEKYPDKIKLFRDKWQGKTSSGEILASMSNILKKRCKGDYCLYIQANEIIHELTIREIKDLILFYPDIDIFLLPFFNIMGDKYLFETQFRKRLVKNLDYIIVKGDAYQLGYDIKRLILKPKKFLKFLLHRIGERSFYISKPIFRYRALFPKNYIKKLETRFELYHDDKSRLPFKEEYDVVKEIWSSTNIYKTSPSLFWEQVMEFFKKEYWKLSQYVVAQGVIGTLDDHPQLIKHLLGKWEYNPEDSLYLISKQK